MLNDKFESDSALNDDEDLRTTSPIEYINKKYFHNTTSAFKHIPCILICIVNPLHKPWWWWNAINVLCFMPFPDL